MLGREHRILRLSSFATSTILLAAAFGSRVHSLFLWVRITWCWNKHSICFLESERISTMGNCKSYFGVCI